MKFRKFFRRHLQKQAAQSEYPSGKDGLTLIKFRDIVWEEVGMLSAPIGTLNPEYYNMIDWLNQNVERYELIHGDVMGERYFDGLYLPAEDIVIFKLRFGL